jgi:chromosome partitioning protein
MRTIAVVNQKGGCGKTTVSINLASALAEAGKKILLVDMDPQSHCAVGLAVPEEQIEQSTIIDCPPAVGLLTFNALTAATDVVVPVETGYFALHGLSKQLETLRILCERCTQRIDVRILASMYDIRTKMAREILSELRAHFADKMFKTVVNFNTKIKEASSFGQPINEYDPASKGHKDFRSLAEEVIGAEARQQRRQIVNSLADQLESISASADELLKATKPEIKTVPAAPTAVLRQQDVGVEQPHFAEQPAPVSSLPLRLSTQVEAAGDASRSGGHAIRVKPAVTSAKLSDYYGVNQIDDAIVFVTLYPRADSVQVAGDFNNWQPIKTSMERVGESGVWQTKVKLPRGKYRYRLVVDGQWQQDPYNELTELNPFGDFNSILEVK